MKWKKTLEGLIKISSTLGQFPVLDFEIPGRYKNITEIPPDVMKAELETGFEIENLSITLSRVQSVD